MPLFEITDYQPIPAGVYTAIVTSIEEKVSTVAGETYWRWAFEVLEGSNAGASVKANSSPKLGPKCKARGWTEAILGRKLTVGERFHTDELVNRTCQLVVKVEEKDGGTFNEVDSILPAPSRIGPGASVSF